MKLLVSNLSLILILFSTSVLAKGPEIDGLYTKSDGHFCMKKVTRKGNLILMEQDHNLNQGWYCSKRTSYAKLYECSSSSDTTKCKRAKSSETLTYFPYDKLVRSFHGGDVSVYSKTTQKFKVPHIFLENDAYKETGSERGCVEYTEEVENKMLGLCNKYTSNCKVTDIDVDVEVRDGHSYHYVFCRPDIRVEGDPVHF